MNSSSSTTTIIKPPRLFDSNRAVAHLPALLALAIAQPNLSQSSQVQQQQVVTQQVSAAVRQKREVAFP
jgi:hypothetical protein